MAKNNLLMVIGVALVVAVIASVATVAITGNSIKVNQNRYGNYKVYTTSEIDSKLENVATDESIWDMLNECVQVEPDPSQNRWCSATCKLQNKKTIGSQTSITYIALKQDGQKDLHMDSSFWWGDNQLMSSCGDGTAIGCGATGFAEELMELETGYGATTTTIDKVSLSSKCICC
ncbi:MAG: hypothetical protein RL557_959 [archaeon]|jgi:hypothetical protein